MKKPLLTAALILGIATSALATPTTSTQLYLTDPGGILYGTVDILLDGTKASFDVKANTLLGYHFTNSQIFDFNQNGSQINNLSMLTEDNTLLDSNLYKVDYTPGNVSFFGTFDTQISNKAQQSGNLISEITFDITGNWSDASSVLFANSVGNYLAAHVVGATGPSFYVADGPNTAPPAVPEPGTMMLMGAGFLGLAIYGKRRKNA